MIGTTMRRFVPDELITPLKLLGKYDWLRWTPIDSFPPSSHLVLRIPSDPSLAPHRRQLALIQRQVEEDLLYPFHQYVFSKALALGPKLLYPTAAQCEALEHVDVNVSFDDYEQPFPTFLLELPEKYRRKLTDRFNYECPVMTFTHHDPRSKYIISTCERSWSHVWLINVISPRPYWKTIEEALRYSVEEGNHMDQGKVVQRVTINFGLLMTHYGVKDLGPVDQDSHEKHLRNARRRNADKAERARRLLDAEINLIEFEQNVVVYDRQDTSRSDSESDGSSRRTHWRRGHFRRQPYGPARSSRKLIFIKPILVNARHFDGDVADTEYRLRTRTGV